MGTEEHLPPGWLKEDHPQHQCGLNIVWRSPEAGSFQCLSAVNDELRRCATRDALIESAKQGPVKNRAQFLRAVQAAFIRDGIWVDSSPQLSPEQTNLLSKAALDH